MNDLKNQTRLISSVTHSEAVIPIDEKISHNGMQVPFETVHFRTNRSDSAYRVRGVTAS